MDNYYRSVCTGRDKGLVSARADVSAGPEFHWYGGRMYKNEANGQSVEASSDVNRPSVSRSWSINCGYFAAMLMALFYSI